MNLQQSIPLKQPAARLSDKVSKNICQIEFKVKETEQDFFQKIQMLIQRIKIQIKSKNVNEIFKMLKYHISQFKFFNLIQMKKTLVENTLLTFKNQLNSQNLIYNNKNLPFTTQIIILSFKKDQQFEMNLNFIQDNDKVHVETQNQIAYKQEIILKIKLLQQDFQDYSQINPSLNQINNLFSIVVKQLFQHVTNFKNKDIQNSLIDGNQNKIKEQKIQQHKKKKKLSIPYATIKKFQILKQKFISCRRIIESQNNLYHSMNINRQNQKSSEVKFYKMMLNSYQSQRQYFKKQTLELEDRIQTVQTQVKKVLSNQNHKYTEFDEKILDYEHALKYEKKLQGYEKVLKQLQMLTAVRNKIFNLVQNQQKRPDQREFQNLRENLKQEKQFGKSTPYGRAFMKSYIDMLKRINLLKIEKCSILQITLLNLEKLNSKARVVNNKFKRSILQSQNKKYFQDIQNKIYQNNNDLSSQTKKICKATNFQQQIDIKKLKQKVSLKQTKFKLTKTDYLIYLKELNSSVKQYFKNNQIRYHKKVLKCGKNKNTRSKSIS